MIILIEPYAGAGPVRLGMRAADIETVLGQPAIMVERSGEPPLAAFPDAGVHAEFAADGHCAAIELMEPAVPVLDDHPLLGPPYADVRDYLAGLDPDVEDDDDGLTSRLLGVGLYAPAAATDPSRAAEGVIVFERGYYQEQR